MKRMQCQDMEKFIHVYLDREFAEEDRADYERHLSECSACRRLARFEQRFKETGDDVSWRFRQFVKATYPFPFLERLALASYEELFLNMNDADWGPQSGFDSNRFFVGLQWKFDARGRLKGELGYLNLITNKSGAPDTMDHLVNINLFLIF